MPLEEEEMDGFRAFIMMDTLHVREELGATPGAVE